MAKFKKGQKVVKIIETPSFAGYPAAKTASIQTVTSVKKGVVVVGEESCLKYRDSDGSEIDPVIPGCDSYLVYLEE